MLRANRTADRAALFGNNWDTTSDWEKCLKPDASTKWYEKHIGKLS